MNKTSLSILAAAALTLSQASVVVAQTNTPILKVVTPQEGQTVYGDRIPLLFSTENFQVVDYTQYKTNQKGMGHIHVWLDEQNPNAQNAKIVTSQDTIYTDVPYGNHTLKAELVNNNHSSLTPPVVTTINFKSAPATSPASQGAVSGFDKNTAMVILVVVALVIVAAWWYTKDEDEKPAKSQTTPKKTATKRKASKKRKK